MMFHTGACSKLPPKLAHAVVQYFRTKYTLQGAAQVSDRKAVLSQLPLVMVALSHDVFYWWPAQSCRRSWHTQSCSTSAGSTPAGRCPELRPQGSAQPAAACHGALKDSQCSQMGDLRHTLMIRSRMQSRHTAICQGVLQASVAYHVPPRCMAHLISSI